MKRLRLSTTNLCWALGFSSADKALLQKESAKSRNEVRSRFASMILRDEIDEIYITRSGASVPAVLHNLRGVGWEPQAKDSPFSAWRMPFDEYFAQEHLGEFVPSNDMSYQKEDIINLRIMNLRVPVIKGPESGTILRDGSLGEILGALSSEFNEDTLDTVGGLVCDAANDVLARLDPRFRHDLRFDMTLAGIVRNVGVGLSMSILTSEYTKAVSAGTVYPCTPEREVGLIKLTKGLVNSSLEFLYLK